MNEALWNFGTRKQVFVDGLFLESGYGANWGKDETSFMPHGVRIAVYPPQMLPEPIIRQDKPWERAWIGNYCTVFEDEGRYRMWYEAYPDMKEGHLSTRLAYAESEDGLTWHKPNLGLVEFDGSKQNNLVYAANVGNRGFGPHGACVFKDISAPPEERYKMVHCGPSGPQVFGAVSPDGLHWTPIREFIAPEHADTQTVAAWDPEKGKYVGYFRHWTWRGRPIGRRLIAHAETEDFRHWPEPEPIFLQDPADPIDWNFYTNAYTRWPDAAEAHLMFPAIYQRGADLVNVHLAVSRDGIRWFRPQRTPILPNGPIGTDSAGSIYVGQGIWSTNPGEWSILYWKSSSRHNDPYDASSIRGGGQWRATIREDGFTALEAERYGECWTVPVCFEGNQLIVNAWTPFAGRLQIGVAVAVPGKWGFVDQSNAKAVPGYSIEDCDPLTGDILWKVVTWKGKSDLRPWSGKPVRLHFRLLRAQLHAFRFCSS